MPAISPSSSSSPSEHVNTTFAPYYPKSDTTQVTPRPLPLRPRCVFDHDLSCKPILPFDEKVHESSYSTGPDSTHQQAPPQPPDGFSDPYLMPSLARNERLRLTMLWYYTRDLYEDTEFLQLLQEKLDLVQTFMEWDMALLGLLSEDVYTRVAAAGVPLAILPRRESTCSHTINQEPGTVFMLPNMASDWRFKMSPHVAKGGLRSYAGVQLRCKASNGEYVALGSLCVASDTEKEPLSPTQQAALVRFADMIATEIVSHSRHERRRQRTIMSQRLAECRLDDTDTAEAQILGLVRETYPTAHVDTFESPDNTIRLPNHSPINFASVEDGLWEDAEYIDELIRTKNYVKICTSRSVRAIIYPCRSYPTQKFLVVASSEVQKVFDDVDAWFVEKCAASLANISQESSLREAVKAKDRFLRGITHQLRTPIHGVLASCELLTEELAARKLLADGLDGHWMGPMSIIGTIRDSGKELMTTVNNILKLNRWAETIAARQHTGLQPLAHLEDGIIHELKQVLSDNDLSRIPIFFENRLDNYDCINVMDPSLLQECIQSLILNALSNTKDGGIIVVISAPPDHSRLIFDVLDTGCGIAPADQVRIFEAFEKINPHARGAGLGLTLAAKIAASMDGNVCLVASSQDPDKHGSHFRAEFYRPGFTQRSIHAPQLRELLCHIPRQFYIAHTPGQRLELVSHFASFLEYQEFLRAETPNRSFAIIAYTVDTGDFQRMVESLDDGQLAICLTPAGASTSEKFVNKVHFFSGPFLTARIHNILLDLDKVYQKANIEGLQLRAEARSDIRLDTSQTPETEIVTPPTPPPEVDPVALLVDDNMVNLRILQMYCEKRNITYTTAVDGKEAVGQFSKSLEDGRPINLILMDLQMPVCDGIEATQQIRHIEKEEVPVLSPCRILMITGQDSADDKARSFKAGANAFYVKPMGLKALDRAIGEYFQVFAKKIASAKPKGRK